VHKESENGSVDYPVHALRRGCELRRPWTGLSDEEASIPCSGSFTEVCSLVSESRTGLGKAGLAGLQRQGLGWPRTRCARANDGELSSGEV
jgi:hypothetical protein